MAVLIAAGTAIVKHLMKAHQGSMEIDSTPGKGAVVSLKFPIFQKTA